MVDRLWIVNLRTMQRQLRLSSVPEPGEFGRWSIDLPDKRDGKWAVPHRLAVCDRWDCGWIGFSLIRRMVYRAFSFRFIQFSQNLQHRNGTVEAKGSLARELNTAASTGKPRNSACRLSCDCNALVANKLEHCYDL